MSTYEVWDLAIPPMPQRSYLYPLEPMGVGTPYVESLTSYILRLAVEHCVSPKSLVIGAIFPLLEKTNVLGTGDVVSHYGWVKIAPIINGTKPFVVEWVNVLEKLTTCENLRFLTMTTWSDVINSQMLMRSSQSWCPSCYEEWLHAGQRVYCPLLWSLQAVTVCLRHQQPLCFQCPYKDCQKALSLFATWARPGYCCNCKRWLGWSSNVYDGNDVKMNIDEYKWQCWIATVLGEIVANASNMLIEPKGEKIASFLRGCIEQMFDGNMKLFAHKAGISYGKLQDWSHNDLPQLQTVLQASFCLGISPFNLLAGNTVPAAIRTPIWKVDSEQKAAREIRRPLGAEEMKRALEEILAAEETPPPTIQEVAKQLGYRTPSALYHRFPELYRAISAKYQRWHSSEYGKKWNRNKTVSKKREILNIEEMRQRLEAILEAKEVPPPSIQDVAKRLGYRGTGSLYRYFPELCYAISARYHDENTYKRLKQELELVITSNEIPPPSLTQVIKRLESNREVLWHHFPDLCHEITKRYNLYCRLDDSIESLLESIVANDEDTPSMQEVAKRLGYPPSTLRRYFPSLCSMISERYKAFVKKQSKEKIERAFDELRKTIAYIYSQGLYPSISQITKIMGNSVLMLPGAGEVRRATLRELGLERS